MSDKSKENSWSRIASGECLRSFEGWRDVSAWTQSHVGKSSKGLAWRHCGPCTCCCLVPSDTDVFGEMSESWTSSDLTWIDSGFSADPDSVSEENAERWGTDNEVFGEMSESWACPDSVSDGASEAWVDFHETSEN